MRDVCENNFKGLYDNLHDSVNNGYGKEIILRERELLTKTFEEIQSAHKKLCFIRKGDVDNSLSQWRTKKFNEYGCICKRVDDYLRVEPKTCTTLMLEKIPLPKFDGNIRNYPQFIKDALVRPHLKPIEAPFALRGCLPNEVKSELTVCDDNIEEMLTCSSEKFANPTKIIDCIISEIQRFRKLDNDDNK